MTNSSRIHCYLQQATHIPFPLRLFASDMNLVENDSQRHINPFALSIFHSFVTKKAVNSFIFFPFSFFSLKLFPQKYLVASFGKTKHRKASVPCCYMLINISQQQFVHKIKINFNFIYLI